MNCDKCGNPTTKTKQGIGKNGKQYTMYICTSGCMHDNGKWEYGFFAGKGGSQPRKAPASVVETGVLAKLDEIKQEFKRGLEEILKKIEFLNDPLEKKSAEAQKEDVPF